MSQKIFVIKTFLVKLAKLNKGRQLGKSCTFLNNLQQRINFGVLKYHTFVGFSENTIKIKSEVTEVLFQSICVDFKRK